ncbi:nitrate transporter [Trichormus sp. NMC-1]|uniref:ABC transporter permease n=1 Tax=Trichormus sp. NMC-1 TaxID=1853259 RepID=UPI0008DC058B|nr:nitrate transporter [Trichormus sp. NMC-1]
MENSILLDVLASLQLLFVGYIPAAVLGLFIGFIIGINGIVYQLFTRICQIPNSIPAIAFLPLALIVFKEKEASAVFVVFFGVFWSIIIETATGFQQFRKQDNNFRVAIHHVFKALRIGLWIAWFTVIATEMLVGSKGLGFLAWNAYKTSNGKYILESILYIAIIGVLLDQLLDFTSYILSQMVTDKSKKQLP